jgi:hypothetical protein
MIKKMAGSSIQRIREVIDASGEKEVRHRHNHPRTAFAPVVQAVMSYESNMVIQERNPAVG